MTKQETIQVLQSIEDRAVDFPYMTACDWVAIAAAKRHLTDSIEVKDVQEEPASEDLEAAEEEWDESLYRSDAFKAGAKWARNICHKDFEDLVRYFYLLSHSALTKDQHELIDKILEYIEIPEERLRLMARQYTPKYKHNIEMEYPLTPEESFLTSTDNSDDNNLKMNKEQLEELRKRNKTRITITIQPTNNKDEDGYKTGIVTVFKDEGIGTERIKLKHWTCDSFSIKGDVICDFEADGGIKLWSLDKQLKVSPGYGTTIYGYGAEGYDLRMDVIDMFSTDNHEY